MSLENLKKYYTENSLIINCAIVAILFFINCFVEDFSLLIFMIVTILILISSKSNGFSMLVFCIPFCCMDGYKTILMFFISFMVFLIKSYYIYFKIDKKRISSPVILCLILFVTYSLLPFGEYNSGLWIKLGITLILALFLNLFLEYKKEIDIKSNISLLAVAFILSSVFYLTYFISPYIASKEIFYYGDDYIRFSCLLINPNTLAMICEICLSLLTFYILSGKFIWVDIIAFVVFSVLGVSTLSKTFLILFSILMLIIFIYALRKLKKEILWIIGILCIGITLLLILRPHFIVTYFSRFMYIEPEEFSFKTVINIVTTGRYELWMGTIEYLFMNPDVLFFGRGFGAPLIQSLSAHNFYISLIYELGIVGSILFVGLFISIVWTCMKKKHIKFNKAILVPIFMVGLLMLVEDLFLYIY